MTAVTPGREETLAPAIRNYLLRELGKLTTYIDNDCQGGPPAKEYSRHVAEGRKIQVEKMLDDPDFRLAAKPADEGEREDAIYSAFLGIMVLGTMCKKAGLSSAEKRATDLLIEMDTAFPGLAGRSALRAALSNTGKPNP
jgi:hypothetical protein